MLTLSMRLCVLYFMSGFRMMQHPKPEQIELRTSIHTPFNQLEAIDISFQRSVTLR